MINRKTACSLSLCLIAGVAVSISGSGCTKPPPPPPVVQAPPPPPPPPPAPEVTPIEQLMVELNIDKRVMLPEDKAPDNNVDRKAVLEFYDAVARGNDKAMRSMLAETDKRELDALVESGAWKDTTAKIKEIRVQTGSNALSQKCALGVVEVGGGDVNFQPQLWYYNTEEENPTFEAAPSPPGIMDKLSGDWIEAWHQILEDEMALAEKPETDYEIAQRNLDTGTDAPESAGGGTPSAPGVAPGGGGRPPPPTIKPPGLPKPGGG